ncbi:tubby-related protein 3-like isoform X1 [Sycon ciliatum]|uniref:tubby-related protein 3-like isoform X1 n=1 Tax=Sycon ciliatum TaxID=27933 RepID=UPI0031F64956
MDHNGYDQFNSPLELEPLPANMSASERAAVTERRIHQYHAHMKEKKKQTSRHAGRAMPGGLVAHGSRSQQQQQQFVLLPPPRANTEAPKSTASASGGGRGSRDVSSTSSWPADVNQGSYGAMPTSESVSSASSFQKKMEAGSVRGDVDFSVSTDAPRLDRSGLDLQVTGQSVAMATDEYGAGNQRHMYSGRHRSPADDSGDEEDDDAAYRGGHATGGAGRAAVVGVGDLGSPQSAGVDSMSSAQHLVSDSDSTADAAAAAAAASTGSGSNGNLSPNAPSYLPPIEIGRLEDFVQRSMASDITARCRLTRKDGTYFMHLEMPNNVKKFVMAAKKRSNAASKEFVITLDATNISKDSPSYVGKLKCNMTGTEFTLYDTGVNPNKSRALPDHSNVREELVAVHAGKSVLGLSGPRRLSIILPHLNQAHERIKIFPKSESESLLEAFKAKTLPESTVILQNKLPTWSSESESFVLNFNGRVTKASVKNFQIVHPEDTDYIVLQFGRIAEHQFTLDFSYPLCPLQAFAIALSGSFKNFSQ